MSLLINETPAVASSLSAKELGTMLERMMLIRAYEFKLKELGILMVCTSVGQEASAVGVVSALTSDDLILTNHRSAGHLIARGADPGRILAEVMGKSTGYCKGKSGTLHISVKELGIVLTSTIVGGELSLTPGVALSQSMLERPGIVTTFFGDGAATEGIFHESVNLSAVWDLPVLYVCENNQFQAFVHRKETMLGDHISEWAKSYGIKGATVDGNDVEAVYEATLGAIAHIKATNKPFLLETYTYRQQGHMLADEQAYVDKQELAAWMTKDPIDRVKHKLLAMNALTQPEIDAMQERVNNIINEAVVFATASPYPDASELTTDVYA